MAAKAVQRLDPAVRMDRVESLARDIYARRILRGGVRETAAQQSRADAEAFYAEPETAREPKQG